MLLDRRAPIATAEFGPVVLGRCGRWLAAGAALSMLSLGPVACAASFEADEQVTLRAPLPATRLAIQNIVGDVTVVADAQAKEITAEVKKKTKADSQSAAEKALSDITVSLVEMEGRAGSILASASHPDGSQRRQYSVEWRITAPPDLALAIAVDVGDISFSGFTAGAEVRSDVGDIDISNLAGGLDVKAQVGDITAKGITGGLTARTDVGEIVAEAQGTVECRTNVGDLSLVVLAGSNGPVTGITDVGELRVTLPADTRGSLSAITDTGDLSVSLSPVSARNIEQRKNRFKAEVGEGDGPKLDFRTEVGDLTIRFAKTGA